jgi:outer membrane lipoprotein-sorting protein
MKGLLISLLVSLGPFVGAQRGTDDLEPLRRALQAQRTQAFAGVLQTTRYEKNTITGRLSIWSDGTGKYRTQWTLPDGKLGELTVCDGVREWVYLPKSNTYRQMPPKPGFLFPATPERPAAFVEKLRGHILLERRGTETILGRNCEIFSVRRRPGPPSEPGGRRPEAGSPPWRGREGARMERRLWIDKQTGLVLKTEERGPDGVLFSSSEFTELDLSPKFAPNDFVFKPPKGAVEERERTFSWGEAEGELGFAPLKPGFLPGGLKLPDRIRIATRGKTKVASFSLGEGEQKIVVVQWRPEGETSNPSKKFEENPEEREGWVVGKVGAVWVRIMGHGVPRKDLQAILRSMKP